MNQEGLERIFSALQEVVPNAVERAVDSYRTFSQSPASHDPKEFAAHHRACKAALAHLDYLAKMVDRIADQAEEHEAPDTVKQRVRYMEEMIRSAKRRVDHDRRQDQPKGGE